MTDQAAPPRHTNPPSLRWAVALLVVEALGVAGVTGFFGYEDVTAAADSIRNGVALTVYFGVLAALLGLLAWFLHRRRAFARAPAIVLQLLLAAVGSLMIKGGAAWLGVPVILLGLVGAGLLLTAATREALGIH